MHGLIFETSQHYWQDQPGSYLLASSRRVPEAGTGPRARSRSEPRARFVVKVRMLRFREHRRISSRRSARKTDARAAAKPAQPLTTFNAHVLCISSELPLPTHRPPRKAGRSAAQVKTNRSDRARKPSVPSRLPVNRRCVQRSLAASNPHPRSVGTARGSAHLPSTSALTNAARPSPGALLSRGGRPKPHRTFLLRY